MFDESMQTVTTQSAFLSNDRNKTRLISMLVQKFKDKFIKTRQATADADRFIVETALSESGNSHSVVVIGTDTDLLVMLISLAPPDCGMYMLCSTNPIALYNITLIQNAVGNKKTHHLLAHSVTGCDIVSALFGLRKKKAIDILDQYTDDDSLDVFINETSSKAIPANFTMREGMPATVEILSSTTAGTTSTSTTTESSTLESTSSTEIGIEYVFANSPFSCNGRKHGHYADAFFDCKFFHQCFFYNETGGKVYARHMVFECGQGTLFNQSIKTCDYSHKVECSEELVETAVPTSSTTEPIPESSFRCSPDEHKHGLYFADFDSNCSIYHQCMYTTENGTLHDAHLSFRCPMGTLFDQKSDSCEVIEKVN
ncbi:hypothetical protein GQR58_007650 [Nymphon striatum]|nr:hypothetical protein GQR58_007650 [Nymphon striatum]